MKVIAIPFFLAAFAITCEETSSAEKPANPSRPVGKIKIGPYPGGYPRVTKDELCVDPRPDHKLAVYLPWEDSGYMVVDLPEVIFSNIGVLFLGHKHIPTIWTEKNVELETVNWERLPDGSMTYVRQLPNKISFGAKAIPRENGVDMELFLENGTNEKLTGLRTQICVLLKESKGFNQLTNNNKFFAPGDPEKEPLVAVGDEKRRRWIATAWDHCLRKWGRDLCPCIHSDPQFPDCPPGKRVTLRGKILFLEGDIERNLRRLKNQSKLLHQNSDASFLSDRGRPLRALFKEPRRRPSMRPGTTHLFAVPCRRIRSTQ